ncbi:transcriptional activator domain-containing protein [bacterium JGI 053]|nr:transcriptional activator domain-containing protein [bacterium JGI 053]
MLLDPGDERALRRLMSLLDGMGDRAGALRAHAGFAARLRADFDAEPSAETEALVRAIRARDTAPGPPPASPTPVPAAPLPAPPAGDAVAPIPAPPPAIDVTDVDDDVAEGRARAESADGAVARRPRRWRRWAAAAALVFAAALGAGALLRFRSHEPAVAARPGRIAILPFTVLGTTRLAYLREGMVDLLAIRLDGEEELDAVDPLAVLGYVRREHIVDADPEDGRGVARAFGAAQFLLGSVIWLGGKVQVIAALYRADGSLVAKATVTVDSERELGTLVDDLTRKLLARRPSTPGEQLSRAAAMTTTSLPALQAFLAGEKDFRAGRLDAAVEAYGRAAREDSTFALALYRLSTVLDWTGRALDRRSPGDVVHQALRFKSRLAPHERMLLDARDAYWNGSAREAERLYREVLATHPDDMEAWNELGEVIFHRGVWLGTPITRARQPFERVLALAPQNLGARLHLARIAALEGRTGQVDTLLAEVLRLSPGAARSVEMRGLAAFGGGTPRQRAEAERMLAAMGYDELWVNSWRIAVYTDDPAAGERLSRLLAAPDRSPRARVLARTVAASMQAAAGRWGAARGSLAAVEPAEPEYVAQVRANLALLPLLPIPQGEIEAIRASLAAAPVSAGDTLEDPVSHARGYCPSLCRAYLVGALSARLGDAAGAARAEERIGQARPADAHQAELIRYLRFVLRARRAWAAGDAAAALRLLEAGWPEQTLPRFSSYESYDHAGERYLRAELLHAVGRDDEALAWYATVAEDLGAGLEYSAPAHLAQARILDARGARTQALWHYRRFIRLWRACDPELRPLVAQAERRAAALE